MTEKELKKLSRADLLEMLIEQSAELQALQERLSKAEAALQRRELTISTAGSIAEASLRVNQVFEAAQKAADQYLENIQELNTRQEEICAQRDAESQQEADRLLNETQEKCRTLEAETEEKCSRMLREAEERSNALWEETRQKLDDFIAQRAGLRELLERVAGETGRS